MRCGTEHRWTMRKLLCFLCGLSIGSTHLLLKGKQLERQVPAPPLPLPAPQQPASIVDESPFNDETGYPDDDDTPSAISKPKVNMAPPHLDVLAAATMEVNHELEGQADAAGTQITRASCAAVAKKTGAMGCGLTSAVSGTIDGCECHLLGKKCPPADKSLGFTGVSPSIPISVPQMGGLSAILCMYWQWSAPPDMSKQNAKAAEASKAAANMYIDAAHIYAGGVAGLGNAIWALTVPPFPLP
eukprot:gnl/TRDRNA2_/TRDRNA2_183639_c0_seq1.p1 gnl/TRDRNA2_/TRDRNA2_183639_c0~~gnl/TRDRNA2_/TRDRNA2_183639_c0_seq1.p1  ORF type:complete len:243 (-),score=46.06 gnl/TRDRNA2_/TRDRNA2_183639_c0_seq1:90-818(-)